MSAYINKPAHLVLPFFLLYYSFYIAANKISFLHSSHRRHYIIRPFPNLFSHSFSTSVNLLSDILTLLISLFYAKLGVLVLITFYFYSILDRFSLQCLDYRRINLGKMIIQKQNILSLLLYTPVSILGFSGTFTDSLILAFRTESANVLENLCLSLL